MKVLFLAINGPTDFNRHVHGFYQRMRLFVDGLVRAGLHIEFLFFPRVAVEDAAATAASMQRGLEEHWGVRAAVDVCPARMPGRRTGWSSYVSRYLAPTLRAAWNAEFSEAIGKRHEDAIGAALGRGPDIVFAMGLETMLALERTNVRVPLFYDIDDIEHVQFAREVGAMKPSMRRRLLRLQLPALRRAERHALSRARSGFVCSEQDRAYLMQRFGAANVEVVPNAAFIPADASHARGNGRALFVGFLGYQPNRDAVTALCRDIWPRVRAVVPDATLDIVGDRERTHPEWNAPPDGVRFLGFVDDLGQRYREADIVVCPINTGGGTRVKLVEAAAYASAIVSTTIGAEGLAFCDGQNACLRDDVAGFAEACIELLRDPVRAQSLGEAARQLAVTRYARDAVTARIADIFSSVR
jgi:glycosyltransferase involved in cell wall biosynthesis